jgi:hypothetical protein
VLGVLVYDYDELATSGKNVLYWIKNHAPAMNMVAKVRPWTFGAVNFPGIGWWAMVKSSGDLFDVVHQS